MKPERAGAPSVGERLIDELDRILETARPVPLTDFVRVDPTRVELLISLLRDATSEPGDWELVDEIERSMLGRAIPLTGQRSADIRRARKAMAELRRSLAA